MRTISLVITAIFMLCLTSSALGQGSEGYNSAYTCWECPVCGTVYPLEVQVSSSSQYYHTTLGQVATLNYNDPSLYCQTCYYLLGVMTFGGDFVLVPCEEGEEESETGTETGSETSTGSEKENGISQFGLQGSSTSVPSSEGSQLQDKVLMIVPPKDYQEMELNEPRNIFEGRGLSVEVASKDVTTAVSSGGENVSVDIDIRNVNISEYRAIVFVGGEGIDTMKLYNDPDFTGLAKKAGQADMILGAICYAPTILANADVLKNKNATTSYDPAYLTSRGAKYVDEAVVRDGDIITANGPYASSDFAEAILAALAESEDGGQAGESGSFETGRVTEVGGALTLSGVGQEGGSDTGVSRGSIAEEESGTEAGSGTASGVATGTGSATGQGQKYRCTQCSYVYDPAAGDVTQGIAPGTAFADLPSSWKCPLCGVGKDKFVPV